MERMKLFLGWSGERSRQLALLLREKIPVVLGGVDPWMSEQDIPKGAPWMDHLGDELESTRVGIFCVTPENLTSTWMHYEAGALSKQRRSGYVCTMLLDVTSADLRPPLAGFQSTATMRDDMHQLFRSINEQRGPLAERAEVIAERFDPVWNGMEPRIGEIRALPASAPAATRTDADKLDELLDLVRSLQHSIAAAGVCIAPPVGDNAARLSLRHDFSNVWRKRGQGDALLLAILKSLARSGSEWTEEPTNSTEGDRAFGSRHPELGEGGAPRPARPENVDPPPE